MEESKRVVLTEAEILAVRCPTCIAGRGRTCRMLVNPSIPLATEVGATELSFHPERIREAQTDQMKKRFGPVLNATDKALITYYAFILLCDSVAVKSTQLIGKEFTSEEVQKFFAEMAIKELKKDGLLPRGFNEEPIYKTASVHPDTERSDGFEN